MAVAVSLRISIVVKQCCVCFLCEWHTPKPCTYTMYMYVYTVYVYFPVYCAMYMCLFSCKSCLVSVFLRTLLRTLLQTVLLTTHVTLYSFCFRHSYPHMNPKLRQARITRLWKRNWRGTDGSVMRLEMSSKLCRDNLSRK